MKKEVARETVIQYEQRRHADGTPRWDRFDRADLVVQYRDLHAQGVSQRHAAQVLEVPRTTLQAWQAYHERLDACPAVDAFFHSPPGLAFLHRLVVGRHLVCTESVRVTFAWCVCCFYHAYYMRGIIYKIKGEKDRAASDFQKVLKLSNDPKMLQNTRQQLQEITKQ